ncbi:hypothetical protein I5G97_gp057 [Mycobacterium phage Curiosium]|uniref:Uncharacterized protein n=1 Tax=Mycobacterium phage Curiosium TaxID=2599859 RepID=A0A5J6TW03_9CAUD|nr:hypothetical protein I5G97_gp057 [Mycobacterium phage Curiosium]QFG14097.1 hypothetical protein PBI_CURIOSIUM_53 [Mycobacterium phage Curiosium]
MSDYDGAQCDVCGLYDARVFDPCGAMWCRVCDLMGLGVLAVSVKADEVAEAVGRRFDETLLFGMDADAAKGLREALGDALHDVMTTPLDHAALLGEVDSPATEAGDPELWVPDYAGINRNWRELAGEPNTAETIDDADKAYVWQDILGAHWGWLDGTGWVAWNSGLYMQGRGAVGPFKVAYRRPVGEFNPMLLAVGGIQIGADIPIGPSNDTGAAENSPTSDDTEAGEPVEQTPDMVAHPSHYTSSPAKCRACGHPIECIDVTEHMGFCLGNATKYVWRCDLKHDAIEDLRKAIQYIEFEIARRAALSTTKG